GLWTDRRWKVGHLVVYPAQPLGPRRPVYAGRAGGAECGPRPPPALGTHYRGDAGGASRRAVSGDGHFLPPGSRSGRWAGAGATGYRLAPRLPGARRAPARRRIRWRLGRASVTRPAGEQLGRKPPPSGDGTAPLTWRLSDTTLPSFRTSCRRRTLVMSSSGLAPTTIRSASLPTSTVPSSAPTPHTAAAWRVAATSVCHGVAPSRTHRPISSSAASLRGRMSEPNAIRTPASRALRNHVACTSDAASARQHSAGESPRSATQSASNGLVAWLAVRWLIARVGTYQVWCSSRSAMHSSSMM